MPIGYVTSPKLSDFYLYNIDNIIEEISRKYNVCYTRYADDILISSNNKEKNNEVFLKLQLELNGKKLILNKKKTKFKALVNNSDTITYLGLFLIKKNNENEMKVSNKYIRETSFECRKLLKPITFDEYEKICGKINYIKLISEKSYHTLLELFYIKENKHLEKKMINSIIEKI